MYSQYLEKLYIGHDVVAASRHNNFAEACLNTCPDQDQKVPNFAAGVDFYIALFTAPVMPSRWFQWAKLRDVKIKLENGPAFFDFLPQDSDEEVFWDKTTHESMLRLCKVVGKAVARMPVLRTMHILFEGKSSNPSCPRPRMDLVFNVMRLFRVKQGKLLLFNLPRYGVTEAAWIHSIETVHQMKLKIEYLGTQFQPPSRLQ